MDASWILLGDQCIAAKIFGSRFEVPNSFKYIKVSPSVSEMQIEMGIGNT